MPLFSLCNLWLLLLVGTSRNVLFFLVNVTKKLTADLIVTSLNFGQFQTSLCVLHFQSKGRVSQCKAVERSINDEKNLLFTTADLFCISFISRF